MQKPSPLAYLRAIERMNLTPGRIWFTDDKPEYVTAARHTGLQAALYTGTEAFARHLKAMGIPVQIRPDTTTPVAMTVAAAPSESPLRRIGYQT